MSSHAAAVTTAVKYHATMSHGESCTGVVTSSVVGVVGGHKKLRRKRKELDALVHEDKVRRKPTSASHHDLLRSDSEDAEGDFSGVAVLGKQMMGGRGGVWACLPGACTLLLLITTLVGIAAAFRLLMLTRRDLDALHARISTGTKVPYKQVERYRTMFAPPSINSLIGT